MDNKLDPLVVNLGTKCFVDISRQDLRSLLLDMKIMDHRYLVPGEDSGRFTIGASSIIKANEFITKLNSHNFDILQCEHDEIRRFIVCFADADRVISVGPITPYNERRPKYGVDGNINLVADIRKMLIYRCNGRNEFGKRIYSDELLREEDTGMGWYGPKLKANNRVGYDPESQSFTGYNPFRSDSKSEVVVIKYKDLLQAFNKFHKLARELREKLIRDKFFTFVLGDEQKRIDNEFIEKYSFVINATADAIRNKSRDEIVTILVNYQNYPNGYILTPKEAEMVAYWIAHLTLDGFGVTI